MFRKYLSAGILIVVAALTCLGVWFGSRLYHAVEAEAGHRAGAFLERTLARYAPDFAAETLPADIRARLDAHFGQVSLSLGVFDMMIWAPDGQILYAARPDITGRVFPVGPELEKAMAGEISVEIEDEFHTDISSMPLNRRGKFFEIYVPIRLAPDNRVVAVAEYYQDAGTVYQVLLNARWQMWVAIIGVAAFLTIILYFLFRQGDMAMLRQRAEFSGRLTDLTARMEKDHQIAAQIRRDAHHLREQQENRLRQLNADIHDGIGQLLTVALLRMDPARDRDGSDDAQAVQTILEEAMGEVHALLSGTSQMQPHDLPLVQAVKAVVDDHVRRTGTGVDLRLDTADLSEPSLPVRIALCRFVREGLHNAFKHAGGTDQRVTLRADGGRLEVSVSDGGGGPVPFPPLGLRQPMGLDNLRRRIERLGGTLALVRHDTPGMRLDASFPLASAETPDARDHGSDRR